ncbi:MAG: hypothetical protein JNM71_17575 [Flavobacterium lindanitolerans]|jgi:hypothetical protein|uniref:Uncharacterized protein n=1 Tax=Flavobacterium microcysteis TaxID=2596891 RepID=A0A501Q126_9FLAO|nr:MULTISPECIES: hypothetical protein [Flavobacterium]MBL7869824.1 hypothetical protein [Flavobacterium lindanitolerans]TPD66002.1 hypothetical protein FJA49_17650 [Flavobacterium microcysteis]
MDNQSLWLKVLSHFDGRGYFSNGLTIPFLLGASTIITPDDELLSVEEFLSEIVDESLPIKISLQRCGNIGEYVIGIFDKDSPSELYRNFGNLYITDSSFSKIEGINGIRSILIQEYQNKVDEGLFSINHRDWGNYSDKEIDRLTELK